MKVVIVEDQTMLRESLGAAIDAQGDMEVVGLIGDAAEALAEVERTQADIVLMDVCIENDSSGIVAARKVKDELPKVRTVVMTGMPDVTFVRQAREAGVDSFVYKNIPTSELLAVLQSTMKGYNTYPSEGACSGEASVLADLSDEEIDIVRLACAGKSRPEIAQALYISEGTLKRRTNEILLKTGFDSILKLAVHAVSTGAIVPNIKGD